MYPLPPKKSPPTDGSSMVSPEPSPRMPSLPVPLRPDPDHSSSTARAPGPGMADGGSPRFTWVPTGWILFRDRGYFALPVLQFCCWPSMRCFYHAIADQQRHCSFRTHLPLTQLLSRYPSLSLPLPLLLPAMLLPYRVTVTRSVHSGRFCGASASRAENRFYGV